MDGTPGGGKSLDGPSGNRPVPLGEALTRKILVRAREGWGRFKVCTLQSGNRRYSPATLKVQKKSAGVGGGLNFGSLKPTTPHVLARRENFPLLKSIKFQQIMAEHGGRRKGAGRPQGSRNRPRLIHGLPETNDPLQWLLALMNHPGAPLRLRMSAAVALLPYFHTRKG